MKLNDVLAIAVAVSLGLITIAYAGWGGSEPGRYSMSDKLLLDTKTGTVYRSEWRSETKVWVVFTTFPN